MKCILLAAGYGTRLKPLTNNCPKPLVKVAGKTILCHITEKLNTLQTRSITNISVIGNANGYNQLLNWKTQKESEGFKYPINIINDNTTSNENRLGAVGDIQFAIDQENIDDDVLIIGGDNLFEFSIDELISFFKKKNASIVAFRHIPDKEKLQKLGIGITKENDSRLVGFEEKPEEPRSTLASTCCYLIKKGDLKLIKPLIESGSIDNTGDMIKHLTNNTDVHAFIFDEPWFDIGSLDAHQEA